MKRYRNFTVTPGIVGFSVQMGCTLAFFGDAADLSAAICNYLTDPEGTEKRFLEADRRYHTGLPEGQIEPCFEPGIAETGAEAEPSQTNRRRPQPFGHRKNPELIKE